MGHRTRMVEQIAELVKKLQHAETGARIAADIDPEEAGVLLFGMCVAAFLGYLQRPDTTPAELSKDVRGRVRLVMRGWEASP